MGVSSVIAEVARLIEDVRHRPALVRTQLISVPERVTNSATNVSTGVPDRSALIAPRGAVLLGSGVGLSMQI